MIIPHVAPIAKSPSKKAPITMSTAPQTGRSTFPAPPPPLVVVAAVLAEDCAIDIDKVALRSAVELAVLLRLVMLEAVVEVLVSNEDEVTVAVLESEAERELLEEEYVEVKLVVVVTLCV